MPDHPVVSTLDTITALLQIWYAGSLCMETCKFHISLKSH